MTLKRAINMLTAEYERGQQLRFVKNPMAWALYNVWKAADGEKPAAEKMPAAQQLPALRHVAGMVPDVLRRLDAAVFTVIDPALAKEAANIIRLQQELLDGKEWRL